MFSTRRRQDYLGCRHQAYPHKILTGRRDRIRTLRGAALASPAGGKRLRPVRRSLQFDIVLVWHGCSRDLMDNDDHVIAVIGDGAMSAGMALKRIMQVR